MARKPASKEQIAQEVRELLGASTLDMDKIGEALHVAGFPRTRVPSPKETDIILNTDEIRSRPASKKVLRVPVKRDTKSMRCRTSSCRTRSLGPGYQYLCREHYRETLLAAGEKLWSPP